VLTEQQGVDVSIAPVGPAPIVVALGDADGALTEGDVVGRETPEVATVGVPEDGLGEATCLESLDVGLELDVGHLGGGRTASREDQGGDGGNARHQDSRVATTKLTDTHIVYYSRFLYFVNNSIRSSISLIFHSTILTIHQLPFTNHHLPITIHT
jgi:hypothetical protein